MRLKLIPAGKFLMGSEDGDKDEKPVHEVTIAKPFYMGIHSVTQAEYEQVMRANPSHFKGPNRPVDSVSWSKAVEFCRELAEMERRAYRLLSEAQWEYACRAAAPGTATPRACRCAYRFRRVPRLEWAGAGCRVVLRDF